MEPSSRSPYIFGWLANEIREAAKVPAVATVKAQRRSLACEQTGRYGAGMKSVTFKISMPDELAAFVKDEMDAGGHTNYSELFREWVRERREWRAQETARWNGLRKKTNSPNGRTRSSI